MNRHHYSIFVHNCRLILLLRLEPDAGVDRNAYRPAEWRWSMAHVCDGKWHHYALSVDFPEVRLYVDGKQFVTSKHNPEVVDDWPLHQSKHVHFTKLVVGACWHGKSVDVSVCLFMSVCVYLAISVSIHLFNADIYIAPLQVGLLRSAPNSSAAE